MKPARLFELIAATNQEVAGSSRRQT